MPQADNSRPTGENPVVAKSTLVRRTFQALTYPEFRVLWCGAFVSTVGTWMQKVAQSWLVFTLTGSAFLLGFDSFLGDVPILLFSLIGGVVADRMDRRRLLLTSQYLQMAFALTLAALIYFDRVSVWHILLLSFLTGTAQAFGGPAYQSLIPTLVEKKDISNAIALNSIQFNLARIIGPVVAGLAFTALGAAACFLLNGVSFLAVIFSLSSFKSRDSPDPEARGKLLDELRTGLSFVRRQPVSSGVEFPGVLQHLLRRAADHHAAGVCKGCLSPGAERIQRLARVHRRRRSDWSLGRRRLGELPEQREKLRWRSSFCSVPWSFFSRSLQRFG